MWFPSKFWTSVDVLLIYLYEFLLPCWLCESLMSDIFKLCQWLSNLFTIVLLSLIFTDYRRFAYFSGYCEVYKNILDTVQIVLVIVISHIIYLEHIRYYFFNLKCYLLIYMLLIDQLFDCCSSNMINLKDLSLVSGKAAWMAYLVIVFIKWFFISFILDISNKTSTLLV